MDTMFFISRDRQDTSGLSVEIDASHLDRAFFDTLEVELRNLTAANRIAVVLRRLFSPHDLLSLTDEQYQRFKCKTALIKKHLAPIASHKGETVLLPDSVTRVCRWLFEQHHGAMLHPHQLLGFNGEVFDGSFGAHADVSQKGGYGPTIHTTYRGEREVRIAVDGNLGSVPDPIFREWWTAAEKIDLTLHAGDMLLFYGFHDFDAQREGNPHEFSIGGRSVCLDRLVLHSALSLAQRRAVNLAADLGHNLLASCHETESV